MHLDLQRLQQYQPRLRAVGLVALVLAIGLCLLAPAPFFRGYLAAFIFALALPLGSGGLLLLHALAGGRWGASIRNLLAAMLMTLPLFILLFLPIAGGVRQLYAWSTAHHLLGHGSARELYLNLPFFFSRAGAYLLLWAVGAWLICRRIRRAQTGHNAPGIGGALAAGGMILYVLTVSFAAIDWVGSLHAHWYSSILGLYLLIGQALAAMAAAVLISQSLHIRGQCVVASPDVLQDLGTLTLTFVALHAYFAFSQYFIIWNGNLPHEISWYVPRMHGVWGAVSAALMLLHFFLPFALLLSRVNKRNPQRMRAIAGVILVMRFVEAVWMVIPSAEHGQLVAVLAALLSCLGIGCAWLLVLTRAMRRHDPVGEVQPAIE